MCITFTSWRLTPDIFYHFELCILHYNSVADPKLAICHFQLATKKAINQQPSVRKDTRQFYSLKASDIATQFYCALHSGIVLRTDLANKITLKPQGFNITFDLSKISLLILICNITYTYRREPVLERHCRDFLYLLVFFCYLINCYLLKN